MSGLSMGERYVLEEVMGGDVCVPVKTVLAQLVSVGGLCSPPPHTIN
jgi:hypothetical protein